jgi:hypothetical protein
MLHYYATIYFGAARGYFSCAKIKIIVKIRSIEKLIIGDVVVPFLLLSI